MIFFIKLNISICFLSGIFLGLLVSIASIKAETGFSGISFQGIDLRVASALGLKDFKGVLVRDLALGEAADNAGLNRGDLIVKYANHEIDTVKTLVEVATNFNPGDIVDIEVFRRGKKQKFKLKLGKRHPSWGVKDGKILAIAKTGLTFSGITPLIRERFSLRWGALGVVVTLADKEQSQSIPLKRGDIIVQINQKPVWKTDQIENAFKEARKEGRNSLLFLVERNGQFYFFLIPV